MPGALERQDDALFAFWVMSIITQYQVRNLDGLFVWWISWRDRDYPQREASLDKMVALQR